MKDMTGRVIVVGSLNSDLILSQSRLPFRGETFVAQTVHEAFGGKGANQAVQCARLGAETAFIGAVGTDLRARQCIENLEFNKVDARVRVVEEATGLGVVQVIPTGEVYATIYPGANATLTSEDIIGNQDLFEAATCVLLQNEVPAEVNIAATEIAKQSGATLFYNAAPARSGSDDVASKADYLIVNEEEARSILSSRGHAASDPVEVASLLGSICPRVVLTLGSKGSVIGVDGSVTSIPSHPANVLDTTGAGDSYVAAFVVGLGKGMDPFRAANFASRVASSTTQAFGAQSAMPYMDEIPLV